MKLIATLFILLFTLFASGCSDSDSNNASSEKLIVGTWEYTKPSNDCTTSFTFKADVHFFIR